MGKIAAFGEIMLRLSAPDDKNFENCSSFDACYGGTEANVLACLAGFGRETEYLTALPDNGLGEAALKHLKNFKIGTDNIIIKGDTLGVYFVERGSGSRGASVTYYRKNSEIAKLGENAFDFDKIFEGVGLFHISGISFALSESSRALAFRLLKEAKARKIKISFDFNYRAKLWSVDSAKEQFLKVIDYADIVLASDLDLSAFLDTDENGFFEKYHPEYLVLRNRKVLSDTKHSVRVALFHATNGQIESFRTPEIAFDVEERVGGGDTFDGGILHKLLKDADDLKGAAKFAIAAFIMKHSIAGDTFTLPADEVEKFENNIRL